MMESIYKYIYIFVVVAILVIVVVLFMNLKNTKQSINKLQTHVFKTKENVEVLENQITSIGDTLDNAMVPEALGFIFAFNSFKNILRKDKKKKEKAIKKIKKKIKKESLSTVLGLVKMVLKNLFNCFLYHKT